MKGYAKFSKPDRLYRYVLGRVWDEEAVPLVWIMLNPSTADSKRDDPTIRAVKMFTRNWGYGGFWVVNLFAFRTPDPKELREWRRTGQDVVGPENDRCIRWAVRQGASPVLAWGRNGYFYRDRVDAVIDSLEAIRRPLRCIGTTANGHPRHPLLAPAASELLEFRRVMLFSDKKGS